MKLSSFAPAALTLLGCAPSDSWSVDQARLEQLFEEACQAVEATMGVEVPDHVTVEFATTERIGEVALLEVRPIYERLIPDPDGRARAMWQLEVSSGLLSTKSAVGSGAVMFSEAVFRRTPGPRRVKGRSALSARR